MPTFSRGGVRLAYHEVGSGFPVVLHTGGAGSSSMWRDGGYVERLAEFRLILLDHRGRGASDRPTEVAAHRIAEYVADVSALADLLELSRYAFVGYSFGAGVGIRLAAGDARVAGLVSLGAVFDPPNAAPEASGYESPVREAGSMAALIEMIEQDEAILLPDWARAQFTDTDATQFLLTLDANADAGDPWDVLPAIRAPSVLIAGSDEDLEDGQGMMAAAMPDADSVHLPGVGHVGAFLRPDEVTAAALAALRRAASS
jgi:pimeloyl-ACP methyl ester carboxylesterase